MPDFLKKKLVWFVLGIVFLVIGWIGFTVFLQQSRITVIAPSPYTIGLDGQQTIPCEKEKCSVTVTPGNHTVVFVKAGYRDITEALEIAPGQEVLRQPSFEFIPVLNEEPNMLIPSVNTPRNAWQEKMVQELGSKLPRGTVFSFEDTFIFYMQPNAAAVGIQSLFAQDDSGEPQLLSSFPRLLKKYQIIPDMEKHHKVLVIDQTYGRSSLYLVDADTKSRLLVAEYPFVSGARWLINGDLLFEARNEQTAAPQLFIYNVASKTFQQLQLVVGLQQLVQVEDGHFIVSMQALLDNQEPQQSQLGQLVTPTLPLIVNDPLPISILDYTPGVETYRLLVIAPFSSVIDAMELQGEKSVLLQSGGKVFRLIFGSG